MTDIPFHPDRPLMVDPVSDTGFATTSWGEQARSRVTAAETLGKLAVIDYRAPAGFGPPRHRHLEDDEVFLIVAGTIVLWTATTTRIAGPGDVVLLPEGLVHTWRAYGEDGVHIHVIVAPGRLEPFFETVAARGLTRADTAALAAAAAEVGVEVLGPPLSDDEVADIVRAHAAT
jgi:quercetin dioxygenase-like cupin family protein